MDTNTLLARLPAGFALKPVTEARYHEMLNVVPPLAHLPGLGFLVGEPVTERACGLSGTMRPVFAVFVLWGKHYEAKGYLTAPEWRALAGNPRAIAACIERGAA